MGKFVNGIYGPIVGKVGPVIGSSWKGIYYLKSRGKRTKKATEGELANRLKFGMAQRWLHPLLSFVREGFKGYSPTSEGFVAAKSYLLLNAIEGEGQNISINPAKVRVSYGDLPLSENMTVTLKEPGLLEFTWDNAISDGAHARDQVMMLAYDPEESNVSTATVGQFRNMGTDTLRIDSKKPRTYHVYAAFKAFDRSRQSHSVYLGEIAV